MQARQLVVLLCSLDGDIFPRAVPNARTQVVLQAPSMKDEHLRAMLHAIVLWIFPPEAAIHNANANDESELLDACRWAWLLL